MTISRRFFLRKGTLAGISAAFMLGNLKVAAANSFNGKPSLEPGLGLSAAALSEAERLTKEAFAKYRYTKFRFRPDAGKAIEMELIRVDVDERAADQGQDCFTLSFQSRDTTFPQGTYTVDHIKMGTFRMFVVPSNWQADGADYVAVFNRLSKA
jgi:hypothetical protein